MGQSTEMHYAVFDRSGARVFKGPASEIRKRYENDHSAIPLWRLTHLERIGADEDLKFVKEYLRTHSKPVSDVTS